ncbi:hypothetical protein QYE76_053468 [Lolium multiflorum]|uniref:Uncharacterized protein n=1 Tax=Lolium multiflorum TaxID=4521 RepID=A0AAD8SWX6_LOLMU|nr:hypothetical protein QYE76_053468 [Lolium multiflorum]
MRRTAAKKEWHPKQKRADDETSAGTNMVFVRPAECSTPRLHNVPDMDNSKRTNVLSPNLRAVAALIVAFVAAVGAAPGGLVIAPMAAGWALVLFILSVSVVLGAVEGCPAKGRTAWPAARRRSSSSSSSSSPCSPSSPEEVKSQEKLSSSLSSSGSPTARKRRSLSVGQGFVILGPDEGVMVLFVPLRWGEDIETKRGIIHTFDQV